MQGAILYACMAKSAYTLPPTIGAVNSAARAIVDNTADGVAVGFPGTNNFACVVADVEAIPTATPLGQLHAGIWGAFLEIGVQLLKLSPSVIYGHSEGGGLALTYAGMLCLAGKPPKFVYAFEPLQICCDDKLRDILSVHGVKVLITHHGFDIVPCNPPALIYPWRQPGTVTELCTTTYPWPRISPYLIRNITDHEIDKIIQSLEIAPI